MEPGASDGVGSSISEVAKQCRDALKECITISPLREHEWAENKWAEFNLWAANTGAFASERALLDARLSVDWETKNLVVSILMLLLSCVEQCRKAGKIHSLLYLGTKSYQYLQQWTKL